MHKGSNCCVYEDGGDRGVSGVEEEIEDSLGWIQSWIPY